MIKAILFDFDGVLAESVDVKTKAFAKLFESESPETVQKIVQYHLTNSGVSRFEKFRYIYREILQSPLSDSYFEELCERFSDLVVQGVIKAPYVPGAKEFLDKYYLKKDLYVVSATPEEELKKIITARDMNKYFKGVFGSPAKKGENILKVLKSNDYLPKNVFFVGDAISDYNGTRETGTLFIGRISGKHNPFIELQIPIIKDLYDLPETLKTLDQKRTK